MKKLLIAAALLGASTQAHAERDLFIAGLFTQKCAVINSGMDEYGDDYKRHVVGMIVGYVSGISAMLSTTDAATKYIPATEGVSDVVEQVTFVHCRSNPADTMFEAVNEGLSKVLEDK